MEIQRLREILENKQHLERSLDELLVIQSDDVQSLETDSQRIIEEAYALGYVQDDELRLVITTPERSNEHSDSLDTYRTLQRDSEQAETQRREGFTITPLTQGQILLISFFIAAGFIVLTFSINRLKRHNNLHKRKDLKRP